MASIGYILDLLEAVSRRDWGGVSAVGRAIAESERKKKHYEAASKILDALDIATSQSGFDQIGTLSAPTLQVVAQAPDFLEEVSLNNFAPPILSNALRREVGEFINEWGFEARLRSQGLSPRHTLLLFGPPGCGKTLLAKHIARTLEMRMFVVRFDTLISSFLGETGGNIRKVFSFLSSNRCVLLLDELDAIAKLRDDKNELGELKRVVISLLQNMDLTETKSLLIAATNHPHMLDPALWRRFQTTWEIRAPEEEDRLDIFEKEYGNVLPKRIKDLFMNISTGMTGADISQIALASKRKLLINPDLPEQEGILLVLIEHIRCQIQTGADFSDKLINTVVTLRKEYPKKYSFNTLSQLSGIPHSTIHSRSAA